MCRIILIAKVESGGKRIRANAGWASAAILGCFLTTHALALDPQKRLTQYTRTVWMQEHGLPQDTIRAIAQTSDGYLWLGTDEGLARFDGYDFITFTKKKGDLPANSISALAASTDGSLWIGTTNGLARYRNKRFQIYTTKEGLPEDDILALEMDHSGKLWIVAGVYLSCFDGTRFSTYAPGGDLPLNSVRAVHEDRRHNVWVGGTGGVGVMEDGKFKPVVDSLALRGGIITGMADDRRGNLWIATSLGLIERAPSGQVKIHTEREGLPDRFVRTVLEDRDGNLWVGTNGGLARSVSERFGSVSEERREGDLIRSVFEDREGNIWVGTNNGLARLRDDEFSVYGTPEGLPSDNPNTIVQDRAGRMWVGFHEGGLLLFSGATSRLFGPRNGLPDAEIFSLRVTPRGDLLICTRSGLYRMRDGRGSPQMVIPQAVFDAVEDSAGRLWVATPGGLTEIRDGRSRVVVPGGLLLASAVVSLCEGHDGALWAGTWGRGLWRIENDNARLFTVRDGLSSDQIRSLHEDREGTLWVGTFGGGLSARKNGKFISFTEKDGLLSDNIPSIADDGESLWLGTTRGICRITKRQMDEFAAGRRESLEARNYGVPDGLRSDQCSPGYPTAGGALRTADGRLWFATSRGIAVFDPRVTRQPALPPTLALADVVSGGVHFAFNQPVQLPPESDRLQIRYTGIHLSAPERVQYFHRLDGLDRDWVRAGSRRLINYNSLGHGRYRFHVRAEIPGGPSSEQSFSFEVLPKYYETIWFRALGVALLAAIGFGAFRLRMSQIRSRFALVLEERARLAREIHDTLAQGFVGISAQLDAVAISMPEGESTARTYLDMARRMARHSLTEARRSVMDLRASMLDGQDLGSALESGTKMWAAGSGVSVEVAVEGSRDLPEETEQHLLRIAQEAVTNALKHAGARRISVHLDMKPELLDLRVADDGRGFEPDNVFSSSGGHFGLIGMRERAKRVGGQFRLTTGPGKGTEVEVTVPLA